MEALVIEVAEEVFGEVEDHEAEDREVEDSGQAGAVREAVGEAAEEVATRILGGLEDLEDVARNYDTRSLGGTKYRNLRSICSRTA